MFCYSDGFETPLIKANDRFAPIQNHLELNHNIRPRWQQREQREAAKAAAESLFTRTAAHQIQLFQLFSRQDFIAFTPYVGILIYLIYSRTRSGVSLAPLSAPNWCLNVPKCGLVEVDLRVQWIGLTKSYGFLYFLLLQFEHHMN